jgi:glycolate oxidase iron-sulfur subunit
MAVSEAAHPETGRAQGPRQFDLDRCVHCGLCLNACPTYRELGLEADSPRGRVYQMVQVASGAAPISDSYLEHIGLCLACRACETACPSGVQYGRLIEDARAEIQAKVPLPVTVRLLQRLVFGHLLVSRTALRVAGNLLHLYEAAGLRALVRSSRLLGEMGPLGRLEPLTPSAEKPFFFSSIGKTFAPDGPRRYRVAFLAGCIANISFARLNEATVRVLQKNGCEVVVPGDQTCCGALHLHSGLREGAQALARRNIDALIGESWDAIITNAAGCGSTLKEYGELLEDDPVYHERAARFSRLMKDVNEFLASIELNPRMGPVPATVTYQDSCHLAHGQRIRTAPRKLLAAIPGLQFREMPLSDLCCGSAGIYNVVHSEMAAAILESKMHAVESTGAGIIVTANPGCMLQLRAGAALHGHGQRVAHVIEMLDEAYRNYRA